MIHSWIFWKSDDFAADIGKFCFWRLRYRHPYQKSDMKWRFCRENTRVRSRIVDRDASLRIHWFLKKRIESGDFDAYIWKFTFWGFRIRHPYQGSEMEWLFCRENSTVRSRIFDRGHRFPLGIHQFSEKISISLHTFENLAVGASEIDTSIDDQTWSGCFVKRIRGSDRTSSIGVQAWESIDF